MPPCKRRVQPTPDIPCSRLLKITEVVEAASFQQREDREAFLERALASPRHPEQVVDLEAVRKDRKLIDFLKDVVAAIEAADQGAGSC